MQLNYKIIKVKCAQCNHIDEAVWTQYGAEQSCWLCDAPAIDLEPVTA